METNLVRPVMEKAAQQFLAKNRDLLACVRGGPREVMQRIEAELMVDEEAPAAVDEVYNELTSYSDESEPALHHSNLVVRDAARGMLGLEFFKQVCLSYLRLRQRGAISYAIALTPEAADQEYQLEVDAGCRLPQAVIDRQGQAQTAAEFLDQEIVSDWRGRLTTAQIRAKKQSNPQYAARLDQMCEEGKLS